MLILCLLIGIASALTPYKDLTWAYKNGINYLGDVKNQGGTSMCWAFASASYLETKYNILTRNKLCLSPEQISDNLPGRPGFNRGNMLAALQYVEQYGIMSENAYPYTQAGEVPSRYDPKRLTPVKVSEPEQAIIPLEILALNDALELLEGLLKEGPFLTAIAGVNVPQFDEIQETSETDHAVMAFGLYADNNENIYLAYQNSYGADWGYQGRGFILICNQTRCYHNRGVLQYIVAANVSDLWSTVPGPNSYTLTVYDYLGFAVAILSLLSCLICLFIMKWCYDCRKKPEKAGFCQVEISTTR